MYPVEKKYFESLSLRENEVVDGLINGLSYKLIADKLEISINTVRKHVRNIYPKLKINSRSQLIHKIFVNK